MPYLYLISLLLLLSGGCTTSPRQSDAPVRIRWDREPDSLDPLALVNQQAIDVANLLSPSLLAVDFQTGQYAPALAAQLPTVQPIGTMRLQIDYHLRPEATWDDGQPVLAADVAFTLKVLRCPGLPHEIVSGLVDFIEECRLDPADPRHVVFICQGRSPEYRLTSGDFPIVAEHLLDPSHSLRAFSLAELCQPADRPAVAALVARYRQANVAREPGRLPGCGPYRLVRWQPHRGLLFQRKTRWWADKLRPIPFVLQARARQLEFLVLPDAAAAALAMQRHELDVLYVA